MAEKLESQTQNGDGKKGWYLIWNLVEALVIGVAATVMLNYTSISTINQRLHNLETRQVEDRIVHKQDFQEFRADMKRELEKIRDDFYEPKNGAR